VTDTKELAIKEMGKVGTEGRDPVSPSPDRLPLEFTRDTVTTAYQLKTGSSPKVVGGIDVRAFSMHKAKAMSLGMRSFPTFVIRTTKQRSSYSLPGREEDLLPSGGSKCGE
jgi:hypothetical protein